DSLAGDPHRLREIESHLKTISDGVGYLTPLPQNQQFNKICGSSLQSVLDPKYADLDSSIREVQQDVQNKYYDGDLWALRAAVSSGIERLRVNPRVEDFVKLLKAASSNLSDFYDRYGRFWSTFAIEMPRIRQVVNQAQKESSESRVAEILRRVA